MKKLSVLPFVLLLVGCSTPSVLPDKEDVKVTREAPDSDCVFVDVVRGRTTSVTGTPKDALNDLHEDAANKGVNYVVIEQYSGNRTAVTGRGYKCP
ncbi:MAG: hypothetical protein KDD61_01355 [Bdellovibrionales bacterium]|nr:hypothetical protein [Bdellovibrionales bacterium]